MGHMSLLATLMCYFSGTLSNTCFRLTARKVFWTIEHVPLLSTVAQNLPGWCQYMAKHPFFAVSRSWLDVFFRAGIWQFGTIGNMTSKERMALTDHFLADGIQAPHQLSAEWRHVNSNVWRVGFARGFSVFSGGRGRGEGPLHLLAGVIRLEESLGSTEAMSNIEVNSFWNYTSC